MRASADPTVPASLPDKVWKDGNTWLKTHESYVNRVKQVQWPIRIVFFGDSITQWWPWREFKDRYTQKQGAVNFGIGGDQVQNLLWRVENGEMDGISPRVAVVLIGTNNLGSNSPEQIAAGITKVVEAIHQKSKTTKVLLLGTWHIPPYRL